MSPGMKKWLLIGGAAVVGYVLYRKMSKPSGAAPAQFATAPIKTLATKPTPASGLGLLEELGLEEELGSLGGGYS